MKKAFREIFSGTNGKLSAKRVVGSIAMVIALGCTIYLVISEGSNSVVENLLMTIFITSVSLLGLPAVTGVWGNSKINFSKTLEESETEVTKSEQPPIPDCNNCEYKQKFDEIKKGTE